MVDPSLIDIWIEEWVLGKTCAGYTGGEVSQKVWGILFCGLLRPLPNPHPVGYLFRGQDAERDSPCG